MKIILIPQDQAQHQIRFQRDGAGLVPPPTTFTGHCEFCNNNVKLRGNHVALRNVNRKFIFLKIVVISKSGGGK